jgi:hypothetical protein
LKKLLIILAFFLISQSAYCCDATISPQKDYFIVTNSKIKSIKFEDENILSGQVIKGIFSEKNQAILKPKNFGKTKVTINEKIYLIEVSNEQKEEWNIPEIVCLDIDSPPKTKGVEND